MKLNAKAFALTCGLIWAVGLLLVVLLNMIWSGYGGAFLAMVDSIYPGYHAGSWTGLIVGPLYALLDGLVVGWIFAWLYNRLSGSATSE